MKKIIFSILFCSLYFSCTKNSRKEISEKDTVDINFEEFINNVNSVNEDTSCDLIDSIIAITDSLKRNDDPYCISDSCIGIEQ